MPRANKRAAAAKGPVMLYWVSTADHDEDWFIFAKSTRSAATFHAEYEGYDSGEGVAEPILALRALPVHSPATLRSTIWQR